MNLNKNGRMSNALWKTGVYFGLAIWALIVLFPFYWMLLTSIKSYGAYNAESVPKFITLAPTFENYVYAFTEVPLAKYFLNTLIYTLVTTFLMVAVTVLASFAFARLNFKGKNLMFTLFLALMMIPYELVIITNFVTIKKLGLDNTFT
ncbi:MAG: carbohydrate ABC transporter permease, partial [Clostridia bacterium]|nr:carbohydrate ABC transporter permease [Clostridia bacterium]